MFTVALMPSYVMPTSLEFIKQDCLKEWLGVFVILIMLAGIGNYVTLKILSCVASVKQMDSYQEVAYNISNSNRGYIFLISSAKFIFMAVTVSLNIDYCASYLASLFLIGSDLDSASSYGVYVAGVLITTIILVVPYWKLRLAHQQREKLALPAFVFAGCFLP